MSKYFSSVTKTPIKRKKTGSSKAPNYAPVNGGAYHAIIITKLLNLFVRILSYYRTAFKNAEEMARAGAYLLIDPYPSLPCSKSCGIAINLIKQNFQFDCTSTYR